MDASERTALIGLRDMIEEQCGLSYPEVQFPVLASKLSRILPILGANTFAEAHRLLLSDRTTPLPHLIGALTIGETYFFRNRAQFEALRCQVLPELDARLGPHNPLIIWSAGCASGEEPYSLAMWIREYAPQFWPDRLRIVATDINPAFLARAREGRYTEWSFRDVEDYWRRRYFKADGKKQVIDRSFRKAIQFHEHNLVSGSLPAKLIPGSVGLVLCRNVLIYFIAERSAKVLDLFRQALMPDGFLILGHSDTLTTLRRWRLRYQQGTYFYQPPGLLEPAPPEPIRVVPPPSRRQIPPRPTTPPARAPYRKPKTTEIRMVRARRPATPRPIKSSPAKPSPAELLEAARSAADQGDLQRADELLAGLIRHDKTNVEGHLLSALVSEQLGDWEKAHDALKKALFLDKKLVIGHYFLAVLNEKLGKPEAALRRYRTVSRLLKTARADVELRLSDGLSAGRLRELTKARVDELASVLQPPRGEVLHGRTS